MCPLLQSRSQIAIPTTFVRVSSRRRNTRSGPACVILSVVHCHGAGNYCQCVNTPGHPRFYPTPSHTHRAAPCCYTWHKSPGHRAWHRAPALGTPLLSERGPSAGRAAGLPPICLISAVVQSHSGVRVQDFITRPLSPTLSAPSPRGSAHPQHQQHPTPAALGAVQSWAQILAFIFTTEPEKMLCAPLSLGTSSPHHLPGLLPSPVRKHSPHVHPPSPSPLALPRGRIPPGSDKSLTLITAIN